MFARTFFNELDQMQKEMNNLLGDLGIGNLLEGGQPLMTDRFDVPAVNLGEDDTNYYVEAQLPGYDMANLALSFHKNHLKLSGQRQRNTEEGIEWHRTERGFGDFERSIRLPRDIDADKAVADVKNGILRVTLPKAESAKPRQISINLA